MKEGFTEKFHLIFEEDFLLKINSKNDLPFETNLDDVIEVLELSQNLTNGKPYVALVDLRRQHFISKEARTFTARNKPSARLAEAIILPPRSNEDFLKPFVIFYKPFLPVVCFCDQNIAHTWLKMKFSEAVNNTIPTNSHGRIYNFLNENNYLIP